MCTEGTTVVKWHYQHPVLKYFVSKVPLLMSFQLISVGKQWMIPKVLGSTIPHQRPRWSSRLFAQPLKETQWMEELNLFVCHCLFLTLLLSVLEKKNHFWKKKKTVYGLKTQFNFWNQDFCQWTLFVTYCSSSSCSVCQMTSLPQGSSGLHSTNSNHFAA